MALKVPGMWFSKNKCVSESGLMHGRANVFTPFTVIFLYLSGLKVADSEELIIITTVNFLLVGQRPVLLIQYI